MMFDYAFQKTPLGYYDMPVEDGTLASTDTFNTSLLMTLTAERRANEAEIGPSYLRRGWWGNVLNSVPNFEIGSKMWLLSQARISLKTLNLAITYLQDAFSWFVTENLAEKVQVTGTIAGSKLCLNIKLFINQTLVDADFYQLWVNTVQEIQINNFVANICVVGS